LPDVNKQRKERRKKIKRLIDKPSKALEDEIKLYKYCPICVYVGKKSRCPKDGSEMIKVTRKQSYRYAKSMLKIIYDLDMIEQKEIQELELIKLIHSYKEK